MSDDNLHLVREDISLHKSELESLINEWLPRLHHAQIGHYITSEALYKRADVSGYALIISSTIVTAMLFLETEGYHKLFLILMSILAATLSGVVSFGRFAEKAELHRSAAGSYGKLRRQLEKLSKTVNKLEYSELDAKLKVLRIEWEYVSENAPLTPRSAINKLRNDKNT
ncbi:SLATT domain-containing protein [Vibrio cholerae]|uniref:SLATT domain-containing protein n=3 Tax=Vibrio cholerae TaxID=666 RepID=UPI00068CC231|nr:SLATT domain-containing protein [Vibrio cholerae]EJL6834674.1 SLATT domain-containing protein [Vibrio cholerae]EKF9661439.1 SLATT domain-containing protein [Vibrio cholerae]EMC7820370.1 SLATT domain-containing protein [Vibrio cholerae]MCD6658032.1 SLATT domain-containing protein [Vibrio cholerae]